MPYTDSIKPMERFAGLFTGRSGAGKTVALASFPTPMYIFDWDRRIDPIKKMFPNKHIEFDSYTSRSNIRTGWLGVKDFMDKLEQLIDNCPYETVAVDSLTNLAYAAIRYFVGSRKTRKVLAGISMPDMEDFGGESALIVQMLEMLKELPCHVILTAHLIEFERPKGEGQAAKTEVIRQVLTGGKKLAPVIPSTFNEEWFFYTESEFGMNAAPKHIVSTVPYNGNNAKTALPLPSTIDFTNKPLYDLVKKIIEEKGGKFGVDTSLLKEAPPKPPLSTF